MAKKPATKPPYPWSKTVPADNIGLSDQERIWAIKEITKATQHSRSRGTRASIILEYCQAIATGTKVKTHPYVALVMKEVRLLGNDRLNLILAAHSADQSSNIWVWEALYEIPPNSNLGEFVQPFRYCNYYKRKYYVRRDSTYSYVWVFRNPSGLCDIEGNPSTEPVYNSPISKWHECIAMRSFEK